MDCNLKEQVQKWSAKNNGEPQSKCKPKCHPRVSHPLSVTVEKTQALNVAKIARWPDDDNFRDNFDAALLDSRNAAPCLVNGSELLLPC